MLGPDSSAGSFEGALTGAARCDGRVAALLRLPAGAGWCVGAGRLRPAGPFVGSAERAVVVLRARRRLYAAVIATSRREASISVSRQGQLRGIRSACWRPWRAMRPGRRKSR